VTEGAVALILAAGSGDRLGESEPKAFLEVAGRPMVARAVEVAAACPAVVSLVVAVPDGWQERAMAILGSDKPVTVVRGGPSRHASVRAALEAVPEATPLVVCHDAARPFASTHLFALVLEALDASPDAAAAVPLVSVPDTVKRVRDGLVVETVGPREDLALAQTPQAFRAAALRDAHTQAADEEREFSDDAALVEWAGYHVLAVVGEAGNFKITTAEDLARAHALATERAHG
jgi:2-C-methyl-D-erythritol 4-phosphate cytidylyltransferase